MDFFQELSPSVLATVGIALAVLVLMIRTQRLRQRMEESSRENTEDRQALMKAGERPVEMLRWQVELHELARDTKAEIDTKLSALQLLVVHANAAAERLERALERAKEETHDDRSAP